MAICLDIARGTVLKNFALTTSGKASQNFDSIFNARKGMTRNVGSSDKEAFASSARNWGAQVAPSALFDHHWAVKYCLQISN